MTAHRAGNVDDPEALARLVEILLALPLPAVFPVHPRTRERLADAGLLERLEQHDSLTLTQPLGYLDFLALLRQSAAVVTDSGGVQKEAYLAGSPLRDACATRPSGPRPWSWAGTGWSASIPQQVLAALERPAAPRLASRAVRGRPRRRRVVEALERWASRTGP